MITLTKCQPSMFGSLVYSINPRTNQNKFLIKNTGKNIDFFRICKSLTAVQSFFLRLYCEKFTCLSLLREYRE